MAGSVQTIQPMLIANEKLTNATITIDLNGVIPPSVTDYFQINGTGWLNIGADKIDGDVITFTGINLDEEQWFMVQLDNKTMPAAGNYTILISVDSGPNQVMTLITTAN
ncbi:BslA/BslB family hydrophobin [Brevibacillus reuszeri]|uniref:BslA/BslB family hydrophobin n=1 Tax=Brevibacillus reuszeri TaxID=54915 RepID=UPI002101D3D0|nr:BslA/BslB family hydrophobin [Brevibacillus reuszeri]MED1856679.1 hypothetical protein [Brevibacillus reuszeri]